MANATENSLMKRTKKELIDIILRKDGVEKENSNTIKELNEEINKLKLINEDNEVILETTKKQFEYIQKDAEDYKEEIDKLVVKAEQLKKDIESKNNKLITVNIILLVLIISNILSLLIL